MALNIGKNKYAFVSISSTQYNVQAKYILNIHMQFMSKWKVTFLKSIIYYYDKVSFINQV